MDLFVTALLILLGGSLATLPLRRSTPATLVGTSTTVIATLFAAGAALQVLLGGKTERFQHSWQVPGGDFSLLLDPLAAFFVLPVALLSLLCSLYAGPYLKHEGEHRSLAPHWFFFNLLVAAMLLVVTASNALLLLVGWELMTVTSFFLVAWDHRKEEVRRAAWLYLVAAHCGLALLLALFLQAGSVCGSLEFAAMGRLATLPATTAGLLFLLGLFGFGVKAGLLPVHVWLPDAHPAAPSHVSALMSGVLVKTGIYGILRLLTLLPPAPAWWGWLLAVLGIGGALYGIALAALQRDIKRCLAYSTIENVGIILLALGFGLVARAQGEPLIALLAFAGGLLHIWNHSLFKGVMFLGAGALVHATGTRDMNRMGGIYRRMPLLGLLWIGGALAISALPPFNGFASEWLLYLGLLRAGTGWGGFLALPSLLLIGCLGVVGALALVTFVRLIGICLLGEPRETELPPGHGATALMLLPMGVSLAGCLAIGLLPGGAFRLLRGALRQLPGVPAEVPLPAPLGVIGASGGVLLLALLLAALLLATLRRHRPQALAATWGCGFRFPSPRMAYTGDGFSEFAFRHCLPRGLRPELGGTPVAGIFPRGACLAQRSRDPVLVRRWEPLFAWVADRCQRLHRLQQGRLQVYLLYIFAACTLLLVWSLLMGRGG